LTEERPKHALVVSAAHAINNSNKHSHQNEQPRRSEGRNNKRTDKTASVKGDHTSDAQRLKSQALRGFIA
jgi:hypothetical protein